MGKILAKRLGRLWVDVDQCIEQSRKKRISEIFEKDGEAAFRRMEKEMISQVTGGSQQVITTGGGAVMDAENLAALKKNGLLIALEATPETIFQRVKESRHRPVLKAGDWMTQIKRLLAVRQPFYAKADRTFHTDGKTAEQVAAAIAESLEKEEEFEFGKDWF